MSGPISAPNSAVETAVETALDALRRGQMIVLLDDEDRENEGDIVLAAEHGTPQAITFMATQARGLICLAMAGEEIDRLGLPPMVARNMARRSTAFTVSIEAREGISTGISAADRAHTVRVATDPASGPGQIASPGHVFPLRAMPGGVLERNGHTEGAVDLMRLAGLRPAAVICEVMCDDGTMMRRDAMTAYVARHGLPSLTMAELVDYRLRHEVLVTEAAVADLPTPFAAQPLRLHAFESRIDGSEQLALVNPGKAAGAPLVRLLAENLIGDAFGARSQDHLRDLAATPGGILLYLRRPDGHGVVDAVRALGQPAGAGASLPHAFAHAAQMLRALGHKRIRLLTDLPETSHGLRRYGIEVSVAEPVSAPQPRPALEALSA